MSFADQTSAFFDELGKMYDQQLAERDYYVGDRHPSNPGPYNNMLTQDETPSDWRPMAEVPQYNEPEVIVRGLP